MNPVHAIFLLSLRQLKSFAIFSVRVAVAGEAVPGQGFVPAGPLAGASIPSVVVGEEGCTPERVCSPDPALVSSAGAAGLSLNSTLILFN